MTIEGIKALSSDHFTPIDIILEWKNEGISLFHGDDQADPVKFIKHRIDLQDESIDKIIINDSLNSNSDPECIISEAKRLIKKNGKIFLTFYHFDEFLSIKNWWGRLKLKYLFKQDISYRWSMDQIAQIIEKNDLLIDKNIVVKTHKPSLVYFEIIKLENDALMRASKL